MKRTIYIGFDPREVDAFHVAVVSMKRHMSRKIAINALVLSDLQDVGFYQRPTSYKDGRLIDELSIRHNYDGSMSTEHAIARFFIPYLEKEGWALFADCDILLRDDINKLFDDLDPRFALYCVPHDYRPTNVIKMDHQKQTVYERKNWSSVMAFNCAHPANAALTLNSLNTYSGRALHRFCWLNDSLIGHLDPRWNHLVGHSINPNPALVHFTQGTPDMPGHENDEYASEWRAHLLSLPQQQGAA